MLDRADANAPRLPASDDEALSSLLCATAPAPAQDCLADDGESAASHAPLGATIELLDLVRASVAATPGVKVRRTVLTRARD